MKDYYYILGVKSHASTDEIKKAYRKLSIKFHPDKNDGDEFYTERFKDILEAYEILIDSSKRAKYDSERTKSSDHSTNTKGTNFLPEIDFFRADKSSFSFDEEVTFSWRTINSDIVRLDPFGIVPPIGQKTYKIKNFKNPSLNFHLIAENSNIQREKRASLTIKNKTYYELYTHFKSIIELEYKEKSQQNFGNHQYRPAEPELVKHKTDKGILEIPACIKFKGQKALMNGRPAPDGTYRFGLFSSITIKDGIIIKG
jgi:DnaJ-class molecular chaperone